MLQFELNVDGIIEAVLTGNLNTDALLKTRSVVRGTNNSGHKFCKWWWQKGFVCLWKWRGQKNFKLKEALETSHSIENAKDKTLEADLNFKSSMTICQRKWKDACSYHKLYKKKKITVQITTEKVFLRYKEKWNKAFSFSVFLMFQIMVYWILLFLYTFIPNSKSF